MGYRVLLIAVKGKSPEAVRREYGVVPTGEREEIPESPVCGAALPGGAYLLYVNDEIEPDDRVFARLSQNGSLIACYANETSMTSYATGWVNGVREWSVLHDSGHGRGHLETTGKLPPQEDAIRARLFAEQEGGTEVNYVFDIPVEVFASVGGVRYDRDIEGAGAAPWETLARE